MKIVEGNVAPSNATFTVIVSRWNSFITDSLLKGALETLARHGVSDDRITVVKVPGAFELPLAAKKVADIHNPSAIIALGAVIRGGTPHFDYVCNEATKGLGQVSLQSGLPVTFGLLTTDSIEQAIERAGTKAGNKGEEAAVTALEMVSLVSQL